MGMETWMGMRMETGMDIRRGVRMGMGMKMGMEHQPLALFPPPCTRRGKQHRHGWLFPHFPTRQCHTPAFQPGLGVSPEQLPGGHHHVPEATILTLRCQDLYGHRHQGLISVNYHWCPLGAITHLLGVFFPPFPQGV